MEDNKRDFKGVWIPKEIWLNEDLSPAEKCLLAEIDSLDNDDAKGCFASNDYLGKFIGISGGACANLISSLKKREHIAQVFFDGRNRGLRLHKNMKSKKQTTQKNESRVHKNMKADYIKKVKQTPQKNEHINTDINTDINTIINGEENTTPPQIEIVNFDIILGENENTPTPENKANDLPLEEKKEKVKKVAAKKEKEIKPTLTTMAEAYPNESDFVAAWGFRFGAKYPNVDASKGYNRIMLYCESSGKKYADYVRVLLVWYTGEAEAKKKQYHYDKQTMQSNHDIISNLIANMDNSNSDVF